MKTAFTFVVYATCVYSALLFVLVDVTHKLLVSQYFLVLASERNGDFQPLSFRLTVLACPVERDRVPDDVGLR